MAEHRLVYMKQKYWRFSFIFKGGRDVVQVQYERLNFKVILLTNIEFQYFPMVANPYYMIIIQGVA